MWKCCNPPKTFSLSLPVSLTVTEMKKAKLKRQSRVSLSVTVTLTLVTESLVELELLKVKDRTFHDHHSINSESVSLRSLMFRLCQLFMMLLSSSSLSTRRSLNTTYTNYDHGRVFRPVFTILARLQKQWFGKHKILDVKIKYPYRTLSSCFLCRYFEYIQNGANHQLLCGI